jgi:hypothetical protein
METTVTARPNHGPNGRSNGALALPFLFELLACSPLSEPHATLWPRARAANCQTSAALTSSWPRRPAPGDETRGAHLPVRLPVEHLALAPPAASEPTSLAWPHMRSRTCRHRLRHCIDFSAVPPETFPGQRAPRCDSTSVSPGGATPKLRRSPPILRLAVVQCPRHGQSSVCVFNVLRFRLQRL